ncbi:Hypothetical protein D9617_27g045630 [Elsinoe fawcettii]|nr:Hypothetical protein D9617_27g045630 [Elsinoe fawcettii]
MAGTTRLANTANRQIIIDAFFSPTFMPTPITIKCAQSHQIMYEPPTRCVANLDATQLQYALDNIHQMHLHIPAGASLENYDGNLMQWGPFASQIDHLASCLLCDQHRTANQHFMIKADLVSALLKSARIAAIQAEQRLQHTSSIQIGPLYDEIKRQQKKRAAPNEPDEPLQDGPRGTYAQTPYMPRPHQSHPFPHASDPPSHKYEYGQARAGTRRRGIPPFTAAEAFRRATDPWQTVIDTYHICWNEAPGRDKGVFARDPGVRDRDASSLLDRLLYPVFTGVPRDINTTNVERFYTKMILRRPHQALETLKTERTRWHPDKIDQRYSGETDLDKVKVKANIISGVLNDKVKDIKALQEEHRKSTSAP